MGSPGLLIDTAADQGLFKGRSQYCNEAHVQYECPKHIFSAALTMVVTTGVDVKMYVC